MTFDTFWRTLRARLKPGDEIKNWTAAKGHLGDTFSISAVSDNAVQIESPNAASVQRIPKSDFELTHSKWPHYKSGRVQRQEIRDSTRFSKYTISIIKYLEDSAE